jgi:hypothetical protein
VALYLSVISYTGMLAIMPSDSGLFLPVALWIALIFTGTVILGGLLSHRFRNAEKAPFHRRGVFVGFGPDAAYPEHCAV